MSSRRPCERSDASRSPGRPQGLAARQGSKPRTAGQVSGGSPHFSWSGDKRESRGVWRRRGNGKDKKRLLRDFFLPCLLTKRLNIILTAQHAIDDILFNLKYKVYIIWDDRTYWFLTRSRGWDPRATAAKHTHVKLCSGPLVLWEALWEE